MSWTQTFNINMTKELLKKINFHKITMRVWDTKDKVSRKVKYYRLKTTGYSEDTGCCGESSICVLFETLLEVRDFSPVTGAEPVSPRLLHLIFPRAHVDLCVRGAPSVQDKLEHQEVAPHGVVSEGGQCLCMHIGHHLCLHHISGLLFPGSTHMSPDMGVSYYPKKKRHQETRENFKIP